MKKPTYLAALLYFDTTTVIQTKKEPLSKTLNCHEL